MVYQKVLLAVKEHIKLKAEKSRAYKERGVALYALELFETLLSALRSGYCKPDILQDKEAMKAVLLDGADTWENYSRMGKSLTVDSAIAKRLCTPTELKRLKDSTKSPKDGLTWADYQARALRRAYKLLYNTIQEAINAEQPIVSKQSKQRGKKPADSATSTISTTSATSTVPATKSRTVHTAKQTVKVEKDTVAQMSTTKAQVAQAPATQSKVVQATATATNSQVNTVKQSSDKAEKQTATVIVKLVAPVKENGVLVGYTLTINGKEKKLCCNDICKLAAKDNVRIENDCFHQMYTIASLSYLTELGEDSNKMCAMYKKRHTDVSECNVCVYPYGVCVQEAYSANIEEIKTVIMPDTMREHYTEFPFRGIEEMNIPNGFDIFNEYYNRVNFSDELLQMLASKEGGVVYRDFDCMTLLYCTPQLTGEYFVKQNTLNIDSTAFTGSQLTRIYLPQSFISFSGKSIYPFKGSTIKEIVIADGTENYSALSLTLRNLIAQNAKQENRLSSIFVEDKYYSTFYPIYKRIIKRKKVKDRQLVTFRDEVTENGWLTAVECNIAGEEKTLTVNELINLPTQYEIEDNCFDVIFTVKNGVATIREDIEDRWEFETPKCIACYILVIPADVKEVRLADYYIEPEILIIGKCKFSGSLAGAIYDMMYAPESLVDCYVNNDFTNYHYQDYFLTQADSYYHNNILYWAGHSFVSTYHVKEGTQYISAHAFEKCKCDTLIFPATIKGVLSHGKFGIGIHKITRLNTLVFECTDGELVDKIIGQYYMDVDMRSKAAMESKALREIHVLPEVYTYLTNKSYSSMLRVMLEKSKDVEFPADS